MLAVIYCCFEFRCFSQRALQIYWLLKNNNNLFSPTLSTVLHKRYSHDCKIKIEAMRYHSTIARICFSVLGKKTIMH